MPVASPSYEGDEEGGKEGGKKGKKGGKKAGKKAGKKGGKKAGKKGEEGKGGKGSGGIGKGVYSESDDDDGKGYGGKGKGTNNKNDNDDYLLKESDDSRTESGTIKFNHLRTGGDQLKEQLANFVGFRPVHRRILTNVIQPARAMFGLQGNN
jgi:hypothetical protein